MDKELATYKHSFIKEHHKKIVDLLAPGREDKKRLSRAVYLAQATYEDKRREWGEFYLEHYLQVCLIIVNEMGLGVTSVISVLLVEARIMNAIGDEEIKNDFGNSIASIVEGLVKIHDIGNDKMSAHAENFRKLLLNLAKDMRVILIKIADRLNIMRKMEKFPEEEQYKMASDGFYLYAPLAHRLGLYRIKSEMEDLSMKYTEYDTYKEIAGKLKATARKRNKFIRDFIRPLEKKLHDNGIQCEVIGRPKTIYSIWSKMKRQQVEFEDIYDKFAIRIIIDSDIEKEKSLCWRAYSLVTETYQPNPKRLRDWISVPKTNGYESLHTTVVVPGGQWVEVQIRTVRMNEIAEKGYAAHWKYKGVNNETAGIDEWLTRVREFLESPDQDSDDMIDDFKLSLYSKEIFVFTPKGDLRKFPSGSTVLDFAYDIHTDLGNSCMGAKINGKNVPIRYEMNNGDRVEIITSKNQKPKTDWINYVKTSKAKSKIKIALQEEKLKEAEHGKEIIKRRFKNWKVEYNDANILKLLKHFKLKTAIDLYYMVATEKIDLLVLKEILTDAKLPEQNEEIKEGKNITVGEVIRSDDYLVIDEKVANVDYKLSKCCNPIFGDEVFGFVTINDGIKIHRINCPNAREMISRYGYRIVKARWTEKEKSGSYQASIRINGSDDPGILNKISEVLTKDLGVNVRSINLETDEGLFQGNIKIWVNNTHHLQGLIKRLRRVNGVYGVSRTD